LKTTFLQQSLELPLRQIEQTLFLIESGATTPFIARYRKEQTGGLDEVQINDILKLAKQFDELEKRKKIPGTMSSTGPSVLDSLENNEIRLLDVDNFNPLKKRPWWRHHIENTFFLTLDEKASRNWDKAKVVHHGTESWAYEEITHGIKNNILLILFIIILIVSIIYYLKTNNKLI